MHPEQNIHKKQALILTKIKKTKQKKLQPHNRLTYIQIHNINCYIHILNDYMANLNRS